MFFVQDVATYRNGKCLRHAPDKIDQNIGDLTQSAVANMAVFPNILDSETGFCGDYVPAQIAPPAVIPIQAPAEPA